METPVVFSSQGQQIVGVVHSPVSTQPAPGVVLCHGFTGNKAEAHFLFTKLARRLCGEGIAVLRFDFRGSGDSEGDFRDMTVSGEILDAHAAVEFLADRPEVDRSRIGILGLSLGGCVAACTAGDLSLVKATVLWSAVSEPEMQFASRRGDPTSDTVEIPGGHVLGRALFDELPGINPVASISRTKGPVLVVHGSDDASVDTYAARHYCTELKKAGVTCELAIIDGADHTYASEEHEAIVIERSATWLRDALQVQQGHDRTPITYADAGVDINAANATKNELKRLVAETYTPRVLTELGSFGGLFDGKFPELDEPVLVGSTDGVGTKLKVAVMADRHDTVGQDLVNHCIDDILVMGARPLFFMDYVALGKHETQMVVDVVRGLSTACAASDCALLGGETAEMPDMYSPGEYDLAGTIVGVVEKSRVLDGSRIEPGDVILGLRSNGLHTNGYSLARKLCFDIAGWNIDTVVPEWGCTVGEGLLAPHRCYLNPLWPLIEDGLVHGLAHITGGGITDNVPRVLPESVSAVIRTESWPVSPIFETLIELGNLDENEALHAFNMGVGMTVMVSADDANRVTTALESAGEMVYRIGEIVADGSELAGEVRYVD